MCLNSTPVFFIYLKIMQVHLKLEFSESENIIFKYIIKKRLLVYIHNILTTKKRLNFVSSKCIHINKTIFVCIKT